jgi:hypothetical protein
MNKFQEDCGMNGEEADAIGINSISHLDKQHINLGNQLQSLFFLLSMLIFLISTHSQIILNYFIPEQRFNTN